MSTQRRDLSTLPFQGFSEPLDLASTYGKLVLILCQPSVDITQLITQLLLSPRVVLDLGVGLAILVRVASVQALELLAEQSDLALVFADAALGVLGGGGELLLDSDVLIDLDAQLLVLLGGFC